jgi:hypothetical protein
MFLTCQRNLSGSCYFSSLPVYDYDDSNQIGSEEMVEDYIERLTVHLGNYEEFWRMKDFLAQHWRYLYQWRPYLASSG